jgi:hypothetical protein
MDSNTLQRIQQHLQGDTRCPLMPSQQHCFHEQLRLWDDPFPNAMVCCWCGVESQELTAIPFRHGPRTPEK